MDNNQFSFAVSSRLRQNHLLAVGAARKLNWSILLVIDDAKALFNPYTRDRIDQIVAIFAVVDDEHYVDMTGLHQRSAVEARYMRSNDSTSQVRLLRLNEEQQLAQFVAEDWDYPLSPYTDSEVVAALFRHTRKPLIMRFPLALPGILYAIPDVHGRADLLKAALDFIRADAAYYKARAVIYFLGDLVDRGMRSREVLDLVKDTLARDPDSILHLGNHDWWFMDTILNRDVDEDFIAGWLKHGGVQTIQSYCGVLSGPKAYKQIYFHYRDHLTMIENSSVVTAHGRLVFAHAGIDFSNSIRDQTMHNLTMIQHGFLDRVSPNVPVVVHGHTSYRGGPVVTENRISLDTGAWATNRLAFCRFDPNRRTISFFETIGSQTLTETNECEAVLEDRGHGTVFDRLDEIFDNFSFDARLTLKGSY
jgi:serine/threonine protein phosphatase 1